MKRFIILKIEYLEVEKKMSKTKVQEARTKLCRQSIAQFRKEMKEWLDKKSIQITKEYDTTEPSVIIVFDEKVWEALYKQLVSVEIVDVIDSIIPEDT